jgi:Nitrile hydratase, alpha chain
MGVLQGEHMVVVENTPKVHNLIVCTLCSCYPWPVLGLPPVWSAPYRSRSVIDPSLVRGLERVVNLARETGAAGERHDARSDYTQPARRR